MTAANRVLLFHGLTGAPSELTPLAEALTAAGYRVETPLLPGHGTTPQDLARTSAADVLAAARKAAADPELAFIGGLSMGALLAIIVASERPAMRALVIMAPALQMAGRNRLFVNLLGHEPFSRLPLMVPKGAPEFGTATDRYDRIPIRWARELRLLQLQAVLAAPKIACPTLLLHGLRDQTASPEGTRRLDQLIGAKASMCFFPQSPHVMTLGPDRDAIAAEVLRFLSRT